MDDELPRLNSAILHGDAPPGLLADQVREELLRYLPEVDGLDAEQAKQLVVRLGFVGASMARHHQEWNAGGKADPERAFDGLVVAERPFREYFAALADRTGEGHCPRDSFASLVRWNVGTVEVRRGNELMAVLPGAFDDGRIRSYTGTPGEESFFLLVKQGEAVELAVNELLGPLGEAPLLGDDAIDRVRAATGLIEAMRRLFIDFAARPPEQSMPAEHFLDVFRQFAVHWTRDDIPPSGALDPEALKRDFLLGIDLAGYDHHVRRLFPALLDGERQEIEKLMGRPTLPERLLDELDLDEADLRTAPIAELHGLIGHHPGLVDWYRLLAAHARAAGAHLMLSKKFLFKPQRQRDDAGQGDRPLVSNRAGTTGMNEMFLERLTQARRDHTLAPLRAALPRETGEKPPGTEVRSGRSVSVALVG
ncbi:hypothetical protein [Paractinoplanes toevensis]|uniref:Uncharacterized protein n=1 Tax=Paractinoplanes toevensis TaxID=571911 RepID=A0A919W8X7_9ACTN|nr:hypothetical protein [Actinoplanes toevensis]GIM95771.1 hypothetical protein Ato02nite_075640 [Actinoplanes toevensis]